MNQARLIGVMRFAILLVLSISWFAMANRCALGIIVTLTAKQQQSCCSDAAGIPGKSNGTGTGECCKALDATFASVAKELTEVDASFALNSYFVALAILPTTSGLTSLAIELDTSPTFAPSFAEAVLQRSLLAHAPPSLA